MSHTNPVTIRFHSIRDRIPSSRELSKGVMARRKSDGAWEQITSDSYMQYASFTSWVSTYTHWAPAHLFPQNVSEYDSKYADVEKALGIVIEQKRGGYGSDPNELGRAIYYLQRFLKSTKNK